MRKLLAAAAVLLILGSAGAPHVHAGEFGANACAACVVRGAEAAVPPAQPSAPLTVVGEAPALEPASVPAEGAPLGAVPGQSPPASAQRS